MEWSGPAWYNFKLLKSGYPKSVELKHFQPLDLGSSATTEYEAKDLAKILKKTLILFKRLVRRLKLLKLKRPLNGLYLGVVIMTAMVGITTIIVITILMECLRA
jgi:hypothetical protein